MRIGVTGASGYVGGAVVRHLGAAGHEVTAFVLPDDGDVPGAAVTLRGDVRDPAAVGRLAGVCDSVVHAAAYVHRAAETARARAECFAVNEGGTRTLVEALEATGRRPHVVFLGSTSVYGRASHDASERQAPAPATAYGESKLAAEGIVLEAARRGGVTAVVLRPAVVYGIGAPGNTGRLARLIRRGWVPGVQGGACRKSMVHVDDLAAAIVRCATSPERVNGAVYNVAGPAVTMREMVEALARGMGTRPRWLPVPRALADAGATVSHLASRMTGGLLPDLSSAWQAYASEATVDASAIARDLGLSFRDTRAALEVVERERAPAA